MAIINCPECGNQVSEFARACPECGMPQEKARIGGFNPNTPKKGEFVQKKSKNPIKNFFSMICPNL